MSKYSPGSKHYNQNNTGCLIGFMISMIIALLMVSLYFGIAHIWHILNILSQSILGISILFSLAIAIFTIIFTIKKH